MNFRFFSIPWQKIKNHHYSLNCRFFLSSNITSLLSHLFSFYLFYWLLEKNCESLKIVRWYERASEDTKWAYWKGIDLLRVIHKKQSPIIENQTRWKTMNARSTWTIMMEMRRVSWMGKCNWNIDELSFRCERFI